jgi:hypothetical protein
MPRGGSKQSGWLERRFAYERLGVHALMPTTKKT